MIYYDLEDNMNKNFVDFFPLLPNGEIVSDLKEKKDWIF